MLLCKIQFILIISSFQALVLDVVKGNLLILPNVDNLMTPFVLKAEKDTEKDENFELQV